jgi:hypothetical protein
MAAAENWRRIVSIELAISIDIDQMRQFLTVMMHVHFWMFCLSILFDLRLS